MLMNIVIHITNKPAATGDRWYNTQDNCKNVINKVVRDESGTLNALLHTVSLDQPAESQEQQSSPLGIYIYLYLQGRKHCFDM